MTIRGSNLGISSINRLIHRDIAGILGNKNGHQTCSLYFIIRQDITIVACTNSNIGTTYRYPFIALFAVPQIHRGCGCQRIFNSRVSTCCPAITTGFLCLKQRMDIFCLIYLPARSFHFSASHVKVRIPGQVIMQP